MGRKLQRSYEDWVTIIGDGVVMVVAGVGVFAVFLAYVISGQFFVDWLVNKFDKRGGA
ncbi:MAG: hypothetical protein ABL871_10335 [Terricaulis sp.]